MDLYMEITFIDSASEGRKTGKGAAMKTNEETKTSFLSNKPYESSLETCQFLLDLKDADDGDAILDTIGLDAKQVENITGEPVKTEQEYLEFDASFWALAQDHYERWVKREAKEA